GTSSLDVISANPDRFEVVALAAGSSAEALGIQIDRFRPRAVSLNDPAAAAHVRGKFGGKIAVFEGAEGLAEMIRSYEADFVINGIVGSSGMLPTVESLASGKDVLLANKETMVMAGKIVMETASRMKRRIVPIDSEMSAIYQCLKGEKRDDVKRLILTASGGPFIDYSHEALKMVTVEQALNHPTWEMGEKNTIDSATMMNKGLEVIEASLLFGIPADRIDVTIHRSSVVHSFVEFVDGSLLCQLSRPDMRLAIKYAMTDPERLPSPYGGVDFTRRFSLTFEPPDINRFPCLKLAYEALDRGGTAPAALNGANEAVVRAFLSGTLSFMDIPRVMEEVVALHRFIAEPTMEELIETDEEVKRRIQTIHIS
ncbi:1-deoxy-D-xylulose-5-phosphate reductoisomerase, partial [Candidatus Latescibacterota bacterium]